MDGKDLAEVFDVIEVAVKGSKNAELVGIAVAGGVSGGGAAAFAALTSVVVDLSLKAISKPVKDWIDEKVIRPALTSLFGGAIGQIAKPYEQDCEDAFRRRTQQ